MSAPGRLPRRAARLSAVQALYQMDVAGTDLNVAILEFEAHRFEETLDGVAYGEVDRAFFRDLLTGVMRTQKEVDPLVNAHLAKGWRLARIDSILRAILRSGAYEMLDRKDVPPRVIISEYVDVARAFFEGDEPKVVNAILDALARETRGAEIAAPAASPSRDA
jgi:N utilization substance protein B